MKKILMSILAVILITACTKEDLELQELANAPVAAGGASSGSAVTTKSAVIITSVSATTGGNVSNSGGGINTTERGVVYNTSPNPTTSNNKVQSGSGSGDFTSTLTGLSGSTTYYVRAYAVKSTGTTYGIQVTFTTLTNFGTITDIDGNVYNTITIGSQVWTAENLKTTKYRDGTSIPNVTDNADWAALTTGAYSNYNNDTANASVYGRLYNWYAATDAHNIAPAGWHIASYSEWATLVTYLGGDNIAGGKAKESGFAHWLSPNTGADNGGGFSALPAGARYYTYPLNNNPASSYFAHLGYNGDWWTSTSSSNPDNASFRETEYNSARMYRSSYLGGIGYYDKRTGYSLRLIKD